MEKAAAGAVRDEKAGEAVEEERLMVRRVVVRPRREALPRWTAANADMLGGREMKGGACRMEVGVRGWRAPIEAIGDAGAARGTLVVRPWTLPVVFEAVVHFFRTLLQWVRGDYPG